LTIVAGGNAPIPLRSLSFTLRLRNDATALVAAVNNANAPVLLAFRPGPLRSAGRTSAPELVLNARSTAVAVLYMTPLITQELFDDETEILKIIENLPETDALADAIEAALQSDTRDVGSPSPLADEGVKSAYSKAFEALVKARLEQMGVPTDEAQQDGRVVNPPLAGGVLVVEGVDPDTGQPRLEVTNLGQRYVQALLPTGERALLRSTCSLLSRRPRPQQAFFPPVCGGPDPTVQLLVYGPGVGDPVPLEEWEGWLTPLVATFLYDIQLPALKALLNVPDVPLPVLNALFLKARQERETFNQLALQMSDEDLLSAMNTFALWLNNALSENNGDLLQQILADYHQPEEAQRLTAATLPYLSLQLDLLGAVVDVEQAFQVMTELPALLVRWRETFDITCGPPPVEIITPFNLVVGGQPFALGKREDFKVFERRTPSDPWNERPITLFEPPQQGGGPGQANVVLVLDRSGSMGAIVDGGKNRLDVLKEAAKLYISLMGPRDQVEIIAFDDTVTVVQEFTKDKDALIDAIDGITLGGATAVWDAAAKAIDDLVALDAPGINAALVITDGGDNSSSIGPDELIAKAQEANIPLFTAGFGEAADENLRRVAEETGGLFAEATNADELNEIFKQFAQVIQNAYRIGWLSLLAPGETGEVRILYLRSTPPTEIILPFKVPENP
jgi:VWFA-related protein